MTYLLVPALAALYYFIGVLVENAKRNWFVGIRTPWTLSSDRVWNRTHKLGGRLFKAAAIITLVGLLFEPYSFWFAIVPVLLVALYLVVFSYMEYKK